MLDGVSELPDLEQRGSRLGKPRPELMPGVGNQWEDLSQTGTPAALPRSVTRTESSRNTSVCPVWNSSGGRPAKSPNTGEIRGSVSSTSGWYQRFRNASPRAPSAVSRRALMLIDGLDQEKSKPPLIMIAPAGIGREASRARCKVTRAALAPADSPAIIN